AAFVQAMGGPTCPRQSHPVKLAKATDLIDIDESTGEVLRASPVVNKYGEPAAAQIIGVECNGQITATRWHVWELERARNFHSNEINQRSSVIGEKVGSDLPGWYAKRDQRVEVAAWGARAIGHNKAGNSDQYNYASTLLLSGAHAPPWSSVNNCTRQSREGEKRSGYFEICVKDIGVGMEVDPDVCEGGGRWPDHRPGNRRDDTGGG
ncbi:MAG: hypothetical protein ABW094_06475, partial [Candidatus Thiodiazotropha sp.]